MKLNDLIEALAAEIEMAKADLDLATAQLATLEADDTPFIDALEQYAGQAQRMGEAADMAGFPGLHAVCEHVVENTLLMAGMPSEERGPMVQFLRRWPELIVYYLRNLADPSCAAGLVDHLVQAPYPLSDEQALKIAHMLGAMEGKVHESGPDHARPVLATPEDLALVIPDDVDPKLLEGFFTEGPEQARYLVDLARNIASGQGDSSDLIAAKRVVHTLKGSGAMIGLRGLTSLSHHLEDILDHFETSETQVAKPVADALLDSAYCLEQMVGHLMGNDEYPQQAQSVLQLVLDLANRIDRGEAIEETRARAPTDTLATSALNSRDDDAEWNLAMGGSAQRTVSVAAKPTPGAVGERTGTTTATPAAALRVSVERVDELFRVSGEMSVYSAAMEARLKVVTDAARALLAQNLRVQKRLFELETVVDIRALTMTRGRGTGAGGASAGFDPLEMDQYSELHSTAHALIEEAADARTLASRLEEEIAATAGTHARQERLSKDLQHLVVGTRMTEVGLLASRLQRNVRSVCQATAKQAELVIEGGETLIDSDVLNRLAEPLLHILRNAVDHGLESPNERHAAGKPAVGRIGLAFTRQGQQVVLRCIDDGRGLDFEAIRKRAIQRGLMSAEQNASEEDLTRMILTSGFSTRQTVSELSGRGVGLDVVREWVAGMNGSIKVTSRQGQGCMLEMRFAASLSTMPALIVEVLGQRFALPSVQVVRAVPRGVGRFELAGDKMHYLHADKSGERAYPAAYLAQVAGLGRHTDKPLQEYDAVIVRVDDQTHALAVERLVDSRELLVKSPGRYARHVRGVAGLSILGDGGIAVNLDLSHLVAGHTRRALHAESLDRLGDSGSEMAENPDSSAPAQAPQKALPAVLIVDDALSVRNSLLQLVQDAGYRARTARDGIEAIEALKEFRPDLVLTDMEMPNLNGVELTSHIKGREDLKGMPVIMITSRSQDKHRRMAEQAGVDVYVTKPYNDGDLLTAMSSLIAA